MPSPIVTVGQTVDHIGCPSCHTFNDCMVEKVGEVWLEDQVGDYGIYFVELVPSGTCTQCKADMGGEAVLPFEVAPVALSSI